MHQHRWGLNLLIRATIGVKAKNKMLNVEEDRIMVSGGGEVN